MCGRYSLGQSAAALASAFELEQDPDWTPRYNIAPTQSVAAIVASSGRQFKRLRWGLIPSWAKDIEIGSKLINARAETVAEKPSFRSAFKQRRCLVLADGFYEWQRQDGKKQPFYFQQSHGEPFAFAGLWERWQDTEQTIESCTIITTQANELLEPVHNRMPVMLDAADYDRWIDPATPSETLQALLHPFTAEAMIGYPVSALVNRSTNDQPDCTKRLADTPAQAHR